MSKLHPHASLDEIANFANGKALSESKYDEHGLFPVYGSNGIIAYSNEKRYDEGVTVIGRVGAYCGSVYFSNGPAWITDNAIVTTGKNGVNNRFLYYLLKTLQLNRTAIGSAQPLLTQSGLKVIKARVPPIEKRSAIQIILSALDDKIENNKQINKTLEEMGRTIFKSWFVDFDPVHAKATGNVPAHMDAETATLFPSSFGDDGLPAGWKKVLLKDLTNIVYGKNIPTKKLSTSGYPVFGGNGIIGFHSKYLYEEPQVLVACRGAASGKVIRSLPFSFVTNNSLVIEISSSHLNRFFLELYLKHLTLKGFTTGSAQPQMTIANMSAVKLLNPTYEILSCFQAVAEPLFDKVFKNDQENKTLAKLRDTLLPKLMSGEIHVKDAEREVEASI